MQVGSPGMLVGHHRGDVQENIISNMFKVPSTRPRGHARLPLTRPHGPTLNYRRVDVLTRRTVDPLVRVGSGSFGLVGLVYRSGFFGLIRARSGLFFPFSERAESLELIGAGPRGCGAAGQEPAADQRHDPHQPGERGGGVAADALARKGRRV
eukprot:316954-Prorocentrum_minimum.AAC.5